MLLKQKLITEYQQRKNQILDGFIKERDALARENAPLAAVSDKEDSDLSVSGIPISSSRFEETNIAIESERSEKEVQMPSRAARRTGSPCPQTVCVALDAVTEAHTRVQSRKGNSGRVLKEKGGAQKRTKGANPVPRKCLEVQSTKYSNNLFYQEMQSQRCVKTEEDAASINIWAPRNACAEAPVLNNPNKADSAGPHEEIPANLRPADAEHPAQHADECKSHEYTCPVDETLIANETHVQDQSCFMGDATYTADALAQYRRRRARRRTGRRVQKRPLENPEELEDGVKRRDTREAKNYLTEYYLAKHTMTERTAQGAAFISDAELAKMRAKERRKLKKIRHAEKKTAELRDELRGELEAIKKLKAELEELESAKIKEKNAFIDELKKKEAEALEQLNARMDKEATMIAEYKKTIEAQAKIALTSVAEQNVDKGAASHRVTRNEAEAAVFSCRPAAVASDISSFFKAAKNDHIEKVNQTVVSRTIIQEKVEAAKPKVVFHEQPQAPKHPIINVDYIKPQSLYKQTIDMGSTPEELDPKFYIPKIQIPFYKAEDEFSKGDSKFECAPFTKDPRLLYNVRKQNHDEIRAYFGGQQSIDVEKVFSNVKDVSNFSPNKLIRKARRG